MKIVCDACGAKYFVSDDNVQKKVVRLTCQKCGHTIHARSQQGSRPKPAASAGVAQLRARLGLSGGSKTPGLPGLKAKKKSSPPGLSKKKKPVLGGGGSVKVAERKTWYYSKDGQSFGPFAESSLKDQFQQGELGEECYVWHRELGDWKPAFETAPFDDVIAELKKVSSEVVLEPMDELEELPGDSTRITERPSSERLSSLRDRLGGDFDEIHSDVEPEPDPKTEDATIVEVEEEYTIDLDVDEASKVVSLADIMAAAGKSPSSSGIDLDVDGASAVLGVDEIGAATEVDEGNSWLSSEKSSSDARADLFAAIDAARASGELDDDVDQPVEKSMLIHIEHLQSRNRRTKRIGLVVFVALVIFLLGFFLVIALHETDEVVVSGAPLEGTTVVTSYGQEISDEDLERFAPESEFSLTVLGEGGEDEGEEETETEVASAEGSEPVIAPLVGAGADTSPGEIKPLVGAGAVSDTSPGEIKPLVGPGSASRKASSEKSSSKSSKKKEKDESGLGDLTAGLDLNPDLSGQNTSSKKKTGLSMGGGPSEVGLRGSSSGSPTGISAGTLPRSRRKAVSVKTTDLGTKKQKKNNAAAKLKGAARSPYVPGLKAVSKSVQECTKRSQKAGEEIGVKKMYITVRIDGAGKVSKIKYDKKINGTPFEECLVSKSNLWNFPPSDEGKPVELRQGFVLD